MKEAEELGAAGHVHPEARVDDEVHREERNEVRLCHEGDLLESSVTTSQFNFQAIS